VLLIPPGEDLIQELSVAETLSAAAATCVDQLIREIALTGLGVDVSEAEAA
jgi:hypothetical protein